MGEAAAERGSPHRWAAGAPMLMLSPAFSSTEPWDSSLSPELARLRTLLQAGAEEWGLRWQAARREHGRQQGGLPCRCTPGGTWGKGSLSSTRQCLPAGQRRPAQRASSAAGEGGSRCRGCQVEACRQLGHGHVGRGGGGSVCREWLGELRVGQREYARSSWLKNCRTKPAGQA